MGGTVPDRLRELLDLVVTSLDDPDADGRALAQQAHFSRDHLDRLLAAATGETPVGLRRRLLLERAAWQLRAGGSSASAVAAAAGYGSLAAFSRAFSRAYGLAPTAFAAAEPATTPVPLDAPNGIHFHAPAGLLLPGARRAPGATARRPRDVTDRLLAHHLARARELLELAQALPPEQLDRRVRPGLTIVWFDGEEATARLMAERLVRTLEVWVASMAGEPEPAPARGDLLRRLEHAARAFTAIVRRLDERGAWDDAFVDALCEPPQSFTYGGVIAHVLTYGAVRRETLAGVLAELGAPPASCADPLAWEAGA
jgi:AraC family transcriptional regulator